MEEYKDQGIKDWDDRKNFCQRAKWLEAREAWIAGDRDRAKEIEHEIFLHMNPWSWMKDQEGDRAEEGVFGSKKRADF